MDRRTAVTPGARICGWCEQPIGPTQRRDAVAFDPPYMPKGTPAGLKAMDERYGVGNQSPRFLAALMADGLTDNHNPPPGRIEEQS